MRWILVLMNLGIALACAGAVSPDPPAGAAAAVLTLQISEGQRVAVPDSDVTIEAVKIEDLTSQGCLGGPRGCQDRVELTLIRGDQRQNVTLVIPRGPDEEAQRVDRTSAFGLTVRLTAIRQKTATLEIERA